MRAPIRRPGQSRPLKHCDGGQRVAGIARGVSRHGQRPLSEVAKYSRELRPFRSPSHVWKHSVWARRVRKPLLYPLSYGGTGVGGGGDRRGTPGAVYQNIPARSGWVAVGRGGRGYDPERPGGPKRRQRSPTHNKLAGARRSATIAKQLRDTFAGWCGCARERHGGCPPGQCRLDVSPSTPNAAGGAHSLRIFQLRPNRLHAMSTLQTLIHMRVVRVRAM